MKSRITVKNSSIESRISSVDPPENVKHYKYNASNKYTSNKSNALSQNVAEFNKRITTLKTFIGVTMG